MSEGISGERVKQLREARGWSQGKLAQRADVPQSLLSELESGKRKQVRTGTAAKIADTLDVRLDDLRAESPATPADVDLSDPDIRLGLAMLLAATPADRRKILRAIRAFMAETDAEDERSKRKER